MGREYRIISALRPDRRAGAAGRSALCTERTVNGAPFYVMDFVDGDVLRDADDAERAHAERRAAGRRRSIVDMLADIHAVDLDAVGLGDLGRQEGYIAPPAASAGTGSGSSRKTRELPGDRRGPRPAAPSASPSRARRRSCTATTASTTAWSTPTGTIVAVLDWEICTLGDPLADVGLLDGLLDRAGRRRRRAAAGACADHARRLPAARRAARRATPTHTGRDLSADRLLHRASATGSSPASSRASTRATPRARWATTACGRSSSPTRSRGWPRLRWPPSSAAADPAAALDSTPGGWSPRIPRPMARWSTT